MSTLCPNGNGFILVESDANQSDILTIQNYSPIVSQVTHSSSSSQQLLTSSRVNKRIRPRNKPSSLAFNPPLVLPKQSTGFFTIADAEVLGFEDSIEPKRPRMSDEFPDDEVEEKSADATTAADLRRGHRWTSYWTQQHTIILIDRLFEARLRHNREHPLNYFHAFSREILAPALEDFKNQLSVPVPFNRVQTKLSLLKARLLKGLERRHLSIDDLPKLVPLPGLLSPLDGSVNGASSDKKLEPNAVIMNGLSLELVAKLAYALGGPNGPARVGRGSRKTSAPEPDEEDSAASPPTPRSTTSHLTPKRERVEPLPDALSLPTQVPQTSAYFGALPAAAMVGTTHSLTCSSSSADNLAAAVRECTVWVAQLVGELRRVPSAGILRSCCCQCSGCKCAGANAAQMPAAASASQASSLLAPSQSAGAASAACDNQQRTLLTAPTLPRNPTMAATLFPLGTATRPGGMYQPLQMGQGTLFGTDDQLAVAMMEMAARQAN